MLLSDFLGLEFLRGKKWGKIRPTRSGKLKLDTEGVETGHGKTYSEKDTGKMDRGGSRGDHQSRTVDRRVPQYTTRRWACIAGF